MITGYSLETYGARVALEKSTPSYFKAINRLPNEPLFLIDYGIADGGTALEFLKAALNEIRIHNTHQITFIANDLPSNPHSDLALNLELLKQHDPKLRVFISPASFYEQVASDQSINLAFSATAMHWLSKVPGPLNSHIHANYAAPEEREEFRKQALDDFEHLMLQRSRELKPGAQVVLVNLAEADDNQSLGRNHQDLPMFDYMLETFQETLEHNQVDLYPLKDTIFQNFYKRKADFEEVISRPSLAGQFRILEHYIEHTPCPYRMAFNQDGDVSKFATGLMKTIRSWSRHTFLTALQMNQMDISLADLFYENLQAKIAAQPTQYSMDYIHSFLHLEKI